MSTYSRAMSSSRSAPASGTSTVTTTTTATSTITQPVSSSSTRLATGDQASQSSLDLGTPYIVCVETEALVKQRQADLTRLGLSTPLQRLHLAITPLDKASDIYSIPYRDHVSGQSQQSDILTICIRILRRYTPKQVVTLGMPSVREAIVNNEKVDKIDKTFAKVMGNP